MRIIFNKIRDSLGNALRLLLPVLLNEYDSIQDLRQHAGGQGDRDMSTTRVITEFVKGKLGCQCPDEVFDHVDVQENLRLNIDIWLRSRINVGNRLLVYVVEANNPAFVQENLLSLVFFGRDEKDLKGFKTFRLVLVAEPVEAVKPIAESMFTDLLNVMDLGDSIHLHVVARGDITW